MNYKKINAQEIGVEIKSAIYHHRKNTLKNKLKNKTKIHEQYIIRFKRYFCRDSCLAF